jgi:hypothetical protein
VNTPIMTKTAPSVKPLHARFGTDIAAACAEIDEIETLHNCAEYHRRRFERTGSANDFRLAEKYDAEAWAIAEKYDALRKVRNAERRAGR